MDRKYIPAKLTYFLFYAGLSLLNTYFTFFLISIGLDPEQAGLVQVARSAITIGSGLFWGWLAHKTNKYLSIICTEIFISTILINIAPWIHTGHHTHKGHTQNATDMFWDDTDTFDLNHLFMSDAVDSNRTQEMFEVAASTSSYVTAPPSIFLTMLSLSTLYTFFIGGVIMIIEAKVYNMTLISEGENKYGRQRLWGSAGIAITPLLAGILMDFLPFSQDHPLRIVFYMYTIIMICLMISCVFLYKPIPEETMATTTIAAPTTSSSPTTSSASTESSISKSTAAHCCTGMPQNLTLSTVLKKILQDHDNLMLFLNIIVIGVVYGIQWNFQFIFMHEIGSTETMMGLCVTIQFAVETLVYPFATKIIKRLGGSLVISPLTVFSYAGLFFVFYSVKTPGLVIIPVALLGSSWTLFHNATMTHLYCIGGAKYMTILQAIYHVVFTGIGTSLSGVIGGSIYKQYGGRVLFLWIGIFLTLFGVFNVIYSIIFCKKMQKNAYFTDLYPSSQKELVLEEINASIDQIDDAIWNDHPTIPGGARDQ